MSIVIVLISVSLCIAITFLLIFFWNVNSGQYDDTFTPSVRMLFEEPKPKREAAPKQQAKYTGKQQSQKDDYGKN